MVLLRSAIRNAWPPKTETQVQEDGSFTARNVVLQEGVYWELVRPFTPVEDRVIVSKRCTTRFYAGNREELNQSCLKKFERRVKVKDADGRWVDGETVVYTNIPIATGEPGTHNFRLEFGEEAQHATEGNSVMDPKEALEILRAARNGWDAHLSKIPTSSSRLDACLNLLATTGVNGSCSFLFHGKGDIRDVVQFHASLDPMALNVSVFHPTYRGDPAQEVGKMYSYSLGWSNGAFPNTQLGCWIARYMNSVQQGKENHQLQDSSSRYESIVTELLDAGADVRPFFESHEHPLNRPSALTAVSAIRRVFIETLYGQGLSMCDMMRHYLSSSSRVDNDDDCTQELRSLLDMLSRKSKIELRFNVGEWVECNMREGWESGVVMKQWTGGFTYVVVLANGTIASSPFDTDEYIRRPKLRFSVGERVECCMDEGWMPGTVMRHWSDLNGFPYEVVLDNCTKGELCTAPCDLDGYIRALNE